MLRRWRTATRRSGPAGLGSKLRDERGTTLIEVLVAAMVLAVGIGATLTVFIDSERAGSTAERNTSGSALAQEEIEKVRALDYDRVGLQSTAWPDAPGTAAPGPASAVVGNEFEASPEAGPEALIGACPDPQGAAQPSPAFCGVEPYTETTIGAGESQTTARVYRFVTWRPESCNLTELLGEVDLAGTLSQISQVLHGNLLAGLAIRDLRGTAANVRDALNLGPTSVMGRLNALPNTANSNLNQQINTTKSAIQSGLLATIAPLMTEPLNEFSSLVNQLAPDQMLDQLLALANLEGALDLCAIDLELLERLRVLHDVIKPMSEDLLPLRMGKATHLEVVNELNSVESTLQDALSKSQATTQQAQASVAQCQSMGSLICGLQGLLSSLLSPLVNLVNGLVDTVNALVAGFNSTSGPGIVPQLNQSRTDIPANRPDPPPIRYGNSFNVKPIIDYASKGAIADGPELAGYIADTLAMIGRDVSANEENTKRVTVAVVLDEAGTAGPREPIWVSTVITDPEAALLGGGG